MGICLLNFLLKEYNIFKIYILMQYANSKD